MEQATIPILCAASYFSCSAIWAINSSFVGSAIGTFLLSPTWRSVVFVRSLDSFPALRVDPHHGSRACSQVYEPALHQWPEKVGEQQCQGKDNQSLANEIQQSHQEENKNRCPGVTRGAAIKTKQDSAPSATMRSLGHKAPAHPVARSSRLSATRLTDIYLGGSSTHW
jgi:hypothetical protein